MSFFFAASHRPVWPFGTDGDLIIPNGTTVTLNVGVVKDYNSIRIDAGGTLLISGNIWNLTSIGCVNDCIIRGTIQVKFTGLPPLVSGEGKDYYYSAPGPLGAGSPGEAFTYPYRRSIGGTGGSGGRAVYLPSTAPIRSNASGADGGYGYGGGGGGGAAVGADGSPGNGINGGAGGQYGGQTASSGGTGGPGGPDGDPQDPQLFIGGALYLKVDGNFDAYGGYLLLSGRYGRSGANGGNAVIWQPNPSDQPYALGAGGGGGGGPGGQGGRLWIRYKGNYSASTIYTFGGSGGLPGKGGSGIDAFNYSKGADGSYGQNGPDGAKDIRQV